MELVKTKKHSSNKQPLKKPWLFQEATEDMHALAVVIVPAPMLSPCCVEISTGFQSPIVHCYEPITGGAGLSEEQIVTVTGSIQTGNPSQPMHVSLPPTVLI